MTERQTVKRLFGSVKSKLLFAFAAFLTVITLLHTALTAWLINRHGEADAFNRLTQQLIQLQDDLQGAREALVAVAQDAARDDKNLSDLAILYSEALTLDKQPDAIRSRAMRLQKTVSLNRLQLILASARLSSAAVYLDGELSHYVTRDEAGMSARRGTQHIVVSTTQTPDETPNNASDFSNPQDWSEHALPALIARRSANVHRVTMAFDFPAEQLMVLRVFVPVQGVPRESFNETIVENLTIATREPVRPAQSGQTAANQTATSQTPASQVEAGRAQADGAMPRVIGQFVFSMAFTTTFLRDAANKTGVLPAVLSPDGRHRFALVNIGVPPEFLSGPEDPHLCAWTADIGDTSYYQAVRRWRMEGDTAVILGGALSRAGTLANIRRTIILVTAAAAVILSIGMALGYVWVSWMVTPINALTAAAASMDLDVGRGAGREGQARALHTTLGRYLESPVRPHTSDEIGALTSAFNGMAERLHHLIGTLDQQVRDRTSQIEAANKELESFSYSVSHDLRAPLRSLDGFSRAVLEDYEGVLDGTGRDYLRRIRNASQHMGQLIDDLLGLAHVSRVGLQRLPVDLTALASAVADDLRQGEPTRHADFIIAAGLHATGDPRLLQVLLQNLLQNAWKFTSTRPTSRIECGQTLHGAAQAYFVRDNGVGFDMAYAHKLFGAFQRLHTTAEFPGTGIGLATVQRIVHRHGGRVWAESQLEQGATFYFTLGEAASVA
jgi:signal transduction histidine kinase